MTANPVSVAFEPHTKPALPPIRPAHHPDQTHCADRREQRDGLLGGWGRGDNADRLKTLNPNVNVFNLLILSLLPHEKKHGKKRSDNCDP